MSKRFIASTRNASLILGTTLLLLIAIESTATVLVFIRGRFAGDYVDPRSYADK